MKRISPLFPHSRHALSAVALLSVLSFGGAPLQAEPARLISELPAYEATLTSKLPSAPSDAAQDCRSAPATAAAGKAVEAAGWQVISEAELGGHALVTFAASSSPGIEGVCEYSGGNLGVFAGERLVGLFWSKEDASLHFGALKPAGDGAVQMDNSLFPVVPVAELVHQGAELRLRALPATIKGCEGRLEIPQAWLKPIGEMRTALSSMGWTPMQPEAADPISADMQARGLPEAESCSGTGQNYCSFDYAHPLAQLRVITVGEWVEEHQPTVVDYELTCSGA